MNHEAAFISAICESPDDVRPRLIYADWLEENGNPDRGEFIRLQFVLAKLKAEGGRWNEKLPSREHGGWENCSCATCGMRRREAELQHQQTVPGYLWGMQKRFGGTVEPGWQWRRGFIEEVYCGHDDWVEHGPAIVRQQPVRIVRLTDVDEFLLTSTVYNNRSWWLASIICQFGMAPEIYSSREDAHLALVVAALKWARREAGLAAM